MHAQRPNKNRSNDNKFKDGGNVSKRAKIRNALKKVNTNE